MSGKTTILAQIDIPELRTHFMRALANYQYRLTLLNRFRETLKESPDLISKEEVDQAQNLYLSALANLREDVTQLQFSVIRAPFSGIITRRYLDPGALVGQKGTNAPLFRLEDISKVRVRIDIPQASVDDVTIGTPARIIIK
ncbi:secretion protein HlyD, partial [mine drainage metagenome]